MDPELLELQRLFQAAQDAKASVRLSDRNVVELVTKLQELGLLQTDLLHTVSGREYLTQDQLKSEMESEIKRLGRVSLIELANTIDVDLYYCEKQAEVVVAESDELMLVQGDILSKGYWDTMAEDFNESLQEAGQISLAELAARLNVGADTLRMMLEPRLGKIIHGKLEGGQLYTQAYVARIKAMIRGAVRALMIPTNLSTVWASLQQQLVDMDENTGGGGIPGEGKLFQSLFNGLLKEGAFSGTLHSGGSIWTPAVFEIAQHEGVESFYSQNSYISYDMLRRLAIPQPKQFLQAKYTDGIALETVFIHSSIIDMVDAAVEEAIDGGRWFESASMTPPLFTSTDVSKLVSLCPFVQRAEKESKAVVLGETCVLSLVFLRSLSDTLASEVKELGREKSIADDANQSIQHARWIGESEGGIETPISAAIVGGKAANSKGSGLEGKTGKRKGTMTFKLEDSREDTGLAKGTKGKKKGAKRRGASTVGDESLQQRGCEKGVMERPSAYQGGLSEDQIAARVIELHPELEGSGIDDDGGSMLAKAIAAHLRPSLISAWEKVKQASFSIAAEERRHRTDTLQTKVDELYASLQLFAKALSLFEDDPTILITLHRHLLRTTASELADCILHIQDCERRLDDGEVHTDLPLTTLPLNTSQRISLAKGLHGPLSNKAVKMVEALDGKAVSEFIMALHHVVDESGLRLKHMDKKTEKALLLSYRKRLASEVEQENDLVAILPKVVALLFAQLYNKPLQAPGRAIASAINHLKNVISEDAYAKLLKYQSATVALLSMLSTSTPGGIDCTSDRIEQTHELLKSLMPKLKEIVILPQSSFQQQP